MKKIDSYYNPEFFKKQSGEVVDILSKYLESVWKNDGKLPAYPHSDPEQLSKKYSEILRDKTGLESLLKKVLADSNHLHHPGYIGHQCTSPNPLAAITAMAGGLLNNGSAVYEMGPANTAMERAIARFFAQEFGFSGLADGIFTSGGSLGNLTALLAARQNNSDYDIWEEGIRPEDKPVILVSEGSHYSISRAIKIMGMGEKAVVNIPVGKDFKMRTDLLDDIYSGLVKKGKRVIALVSGACSTATGSYDDLEKISEFCQKNKIWHHVDGAHGGPAILSKKYKYLLNGVEKADSILIDFHKMLMTPGLNTLVLFRNQDHSYSTFAQKASYLLDDDAEKDWYNLAKRTMECTKSMMGLNVFAQLALGGKELFEENIDRLYDQGKVFAELCNANKDIELAVEPESNIVCFRFTGGNPEKLNSINLKIREEILKKGDFYIVQTKLKEKQYLRVSIMNPKTSVDDFRKLLDKVIELGSVFSNN